jgi:DNA-binding response OmpR family regulator
METIFIVEDDLKLAETLKRYLSRSGYQTFHRDDGEEALDFIKKNNSRLDLILLDIKLPSLDGMNLCEKIREFGIQIPIIMLTNVGSIDTITSTLNTGADDYLTKPFALPEVLARVRAMLRRPSYFESRILKAANITLNLDTREASYRGSVLKLRRREFELLHYLMRNRNLTLSREQMLYNVWSNEDDQPYPNTVDVHIRQIRKKLAKVKQGSEKIIQTVYGFGYRFSTNN